MLGRGLFPYNYPEQISPTDFYLQTRLQATFFKENEIPDLASVMGATSGASLQSYPPPPNPRHTQMNEAISGAVTRMAGEAWRHWAKGENEIRGAYSGLT